jgi:hypothetical protein
VATAAGLRPATWGAGSTFSRRRVGRARSIIAFVGEFGQERGLPFLEGGELGPELLQLAVDLRHFGPRLPLPQVTVTTPGPDRVFDLAAEQPQPRVPCIAAGRYWSLPASIAA